MDKSYYFPRHIHNGAKALKFIDGEILAIRYKEMLGNSPSQDHVVYSPDVYVWSRFANMQKHISCEIIRKYYYTSVTGDEVKIEDVYESLKGVGIEQPRVFKKPKGKSSMRVDISLATEMLSHAHRGNYDVAVLVTGDEDYVPLVEAVASEGKRIVLWAFTSGLSKKLERASDHSFDLSTIFFQPSSFVERAF